MNEPLHVEELLADEPEAESASASPLARRRPALAERARRPAVAPRTRGRLVGEGSAGESDANSADESKDGADHESTEESPHRRIWEDPSVGWAWRKCPAAEWTPAPGVQLAHGTLMHHLMHPLRPRPVSVGAHIPTARLP